ncbi:MAG: inositol monophosphatase [Candidatus Dojkabacteria bacterium]|nr:inositol monophosphatase [Candidatus Dojkabacteria bacterium]
MWDQRVEKVKNIAKKAGDRLLELFGSEIGTSSKGKRDIVTEADIESEKIIKEELDKLFPDELVISEESDVGLEYSKKSFRKCWIVDPLDGTRNFSIGNPNFVVSIGYVDSKNSYQGVIYYPILNHFFFTKNKKASLNGKEINVNPRKQLADSIVGFWDKREKDPYWRGPDIYNSLRGKVKVLRMFGTSALEKAWVSSGQLDLYVGNSSSIFGAPAGVALVRNAGGVVYNLKGDEWELGDVGLVCGNKSIVKKALTHL